MRSHRAFTLWVQIVPEYTGVAKLTEAKCLSSKTICLLKNLAADQSARSSRTNRLARRSPFERFPLPGLAAKTIPWNRAALKPKDGAASEL